MKKIAFFIIIGITAPLLGMDEITVEPALTTTNNLATMSEHSHTASQGDSCITCDECCNQYCAPLKAPADTCRICSELACAGSLAVGCDITCFFFVPFAKCCCQPDEYEKKKIDPPSFCCFTRELIRRIRSYQADKKTVHPHQSIIISQSQ